MKHYIFKHSFRIPDSRMNDVRSLRNYIADHLGISMSLNDVYLMWCEVSEDWAASWLDITVHYEGQSREEFLLYVIEKYCIEVE